MAIAWRSILRLTDHYLLLVEACQEIDDERVLLLTRRSGRGKTSGVDLAQIGNRSASLFHIRDGKVTRLTLYFDRDRALADLGLDGQAASKNVSLSAAMRRHHGGSPRVCST